MSILDILFIIRGYLKGIWQYRWYGIVTLWVLSFSGMMAVYMLPDTYVAKARVLVDTDSLLKPLLKDISVSTNPSNRIAQITRTLLSRPNLERIAQMSDLDLKVRNEIEKEELLDELSKRISIKQTPKNQIFNISFEHEDPRQARLVVQSILNIFVESTLSNTRTDTQKAQKFLDEQIDYYEEQLVLAEQRLAEFKRQNLESLPRQNLGAYQSLQSILSELEHAKLKRTVTEKRIEALTLQLKNQTESEMPISIGISVHPLTQRMNDLQKIYQELISRYTDQHPDVKQIKQEIRRIENIMSSTKPAEVDDIYQQPIPMSPVVQQLKMELAQGYADLAALNSIIEELTSMASNMRKKIDQVIKSETQLANLNRDYQINQKNFNALLERREAAKIAEDVDDTAQAIKFKIVDPPFVPSQPSGPNRLLLNIAVLFLSIVTGFGACVARLILGLKFFDEKSIAKQLSLPVICTVPRVIESKQGVILQYKDQILFSFALLSFAFALAILMFFTT